MDTTYDKATLADIEELVQLRLAYLCDDFGELAPEQCLQLADNIPPYLTEHMDNDLSIHVARKGGAIVSCAWLLRVEKPPSPRFPHGHTGILFNVYTADDFRHQGLATNIMHRLIDEANELCLDVIELHATDDGYPLYCSLGFADDSSTHKAMRMVLTP